MQLPRQPVLRYVRGELMEPLSNNEAIVRWGIDGQFRTQWANQVIFEENGQKILWEPVPGGFDYVTPTRTLEALRIDGEQAVFNAMLYANCATDSYVLCRTTRYRGGIERDQLVAWDKGEETGFSKNALYYNNADRFLVMQDILPHMQQGSGIATLCYSAIGCVHYDENDPWACKGMADTGRLTHYRGIDTNIHGLNAGGYSLADILKVEDASYQDEDDNWIWRQRIIRVSCINDYYATHYNDDPDFVPDAEWMIEDQLGVTATGAPTLDPIFKLQGAIYITFSATSHGQVLAAYCGHNGPGSDSYLSGADLNALTGNAFGLKIFCPLGKPHPQQPRQVPG